jgi:hypothetical protein
MLKQYDSKYGTRFATVGAYEPTPTRRSHQLNLLTGLLRELRHRGYVSHQRSLLVAQDAPDRVAKVINIQRERKP